MTLISAPPLAVAYGTLGRAVRPRRRLRRHARRRQRCTRRAPR
ncbi:hypothetical protein MBEHAL_1538 [Halarchaeum acidiphilum MH1-52-1]|uniref:Uncharacterized protein n=1 Tax=Halarchaeum acidiphilum MH1-52-1 TaxID=1261545 RepID=U3ADC3_9EURY|nr:hypothetical protein MBEHAL_1538 [Halarchaeum acidiphilum MH1-52-1]